VPSYRPNVAALMLRADGALLICERRGEPGAWQFPQGGVDPGESHDEALAREIREEIGLTPNCYQVLEQRGGYRYLYPEGVREKKRRKHGHVGQEQEYYLCQLNGEAREIDVRQRPREFARYRWIRPEEFKLSWLPEFKRDVYRRVMADFFGVEL
jgi:putative (di)nucleoside polyphosphate hydrolase